jgi:hypothetical protein
MTPTPSPGGSTYKYNIRLCCDGGATPGVVEVTFTLSAGDVFVDTNGNCWAVTTPSTGSPTVTFDTYVGKDCRECMEIYGCVWEIQCCPGYSFTDYVSDLGWAGMIYPGAFVKCSNDFCYEVIQSVIATPTESIVSVYPSCDECSGDSGNICK